MKVLTNKTKIVNFLLVPLFHHVLAVWTRFDIIYFQIFCFKKIGSLYVLGYKAENTKFIYNLWFNLTREETHNLDHTG